jgi:trehalose 6-phosphate synthase/phosphatase
MENIEYPELIREYRKAAKKLVLLDYDGTLVNYELIPDNARLSEKLVETLLKLNNTSQTKVIIISGRSHYDIDKLLDHLPIDIVAEHGAMIKEGGVWKKQVINNDGWKKKVIPVLNQITSACTGSYVEKKIFSLAWHYRNSNTHLGYIYSRELIKVVEQIVHSCNLKILDGNRVVEIMTNEIGKGKAVKKLLEQYDYDFILCIGDDATDEEMFEYLLNNGCAFTIKVGNGDTHAKSKLSGINDVELLLKHLT